MALNSFKLGLAVAVISFVVIAVLNNRESKFAAPIKVAAVHVLSVRQGSVPNDLGVLLVPDLNHMDVWGNKVVAKN